MAIQKYRADTSVTTKGSRTMPATLFDIHLYAQNSRRYLHTSDPRGHYLGTVPAEQADLAGTLDHADNLVRPERNATRDCVPAQWRKAFDRAGAIWFGDTTGIGSLTMYTARGRLLGTIYLTARHV